MAEQPTPPDWAIERAKQLHLEAGGVFTPVFHVFADYIAKHEEAPVDPLLIEARKIAAAQYTLHGELSVNSTETLAGRRDTSGLVMAALTALRRGIEIGTSA